MNFARHPDGPRALALAARMADMARATCRSYFRGAIAVEQKIDRSPVTLADRAIETQMRLMIRAEFPTHGIRGEEFAAETGTEFTWVLDPIDGTKSFISGFPLFGSLIALLLGEQPVLGVIEAPALNERWTASRGSPTRFNEVPVHTSDCATIDTARVYSTSADTFQGEQWRRFDTYTRRAAMRRFGGDCYLYGMLASGHCDLVIESGLKPHDFMALIPVVEGAGGRISDWHGATLNSSSGDCVVAAGTEALWAQAVGALAGP
jgi:myo-inositol-1(or 4)-monophosphatase